MSYKAKKEKNYIFFSKNLLTRKKPYGKLVTSKHPMFTDKSGWYWRVFRQITYIILRRVSDMKRILVLLMSVVMLVSMLFATAAFADERTKVRIAWLNLPDRDTMDPINGLEYKGSSYLKDLLEEKHPNVEIEFIHLPSDGWIQKTETLVANGEADIAYYTNQVAAYQWFEDHRTFMANDPNFTEQTFEDTFLPGPKHYTRFRSYDAPEKTDAIYGLPYAQASYWLMYDKVLFEQWGVEVPTGPVTFEQLREMALKMTGENPVTGQQNFGIYIMPFWCEWFGVGEDCYPVVENETMNIADLDMDKYVEYIKDDENVLNFFTTLQDMVKCTPPGAASWSGNEKWMTPDNDIAIMMHAFSNNAYVPHMKAGNKDVTDRFVPFQYPVGDLGMSMFPEIYHMAVVKDSPVKDLAWEVLKTISTDKDVLNLIFNNYATQMVPTLQDPSGLEIMDIPFVAERYEDRKNHSFISDDYWYWREPINKIFSTFFAGEMSPEEARTAFYDNTVEWINNKIAQTAK